MRIQSGLVGYEDNSGLVSGHECSYRYKKRPIWNIVSSFSIESTLEFIVTTILP